MSSSILEFAERLESDIRRRRLVPGHKYLTAEESAELLGTSAATANRALRMLAERDVVVRRRNRGTFVGRAVQDDAVPKVQVLSILAPESIRGAVRFDLVIDGITASFPEV